MEPHFLASVKYQISGSRRIMAVRAIDFDFYLSEHPPANIKPGTKSTNDLADIFYSLSQDYLDMMGNNGVGVHTAIVEPNTLAYIPA
eukprot:15470749-Alexandrium_andersonii.AAC.1